MSILKGPGSSITFENLESFRMKLPINLAPHLPIRAKPIIFDFWRNFVDPDIWLCVEGEDGFLRDIMGRSGTAGA